VEVVNACSNIEYCNTAKEKFEVNWFRLGVPSEDR
jgi:hypothetical protein